VSSTIRPRTVLFTRIRRKGEERGGRRVAEEDRGRER
jgi:hypothetical protein